MKYIASMAELEPELSLDELKHLRALNRAVDDLFEESLKHRESVAQTFRRALPQLLTLTGATGIAITTLNEELVEETFHAGKLDDRPRQVLAEHPWGVCRLGEGTLVTQALDVVGLKVGSIGMLFGVDHPAVGKDGQLARIVDTVAEQLDTVLATVQTASEKHQLLVAINKSLGDRVFEAGMDQAVRILTERVRLPGFLLVFRDAIDSKVLHYRVYREGQLEHESSRRRHPGLEQAIALQGEGVLLPEDLSLRQALGSHRAVESVLISGLSAGRSLGKILVWSNGGGFSAFTLDLIHLLSSALSQRLVDYNRERIHLSQFFSAAVMDELLGDPDYEARYLSARDEEVGILFADINSFTRICEQVLEKPEKIGQFVDDWSEGAVNLLFAHGGVFDKMVGDCVIGLFGPPFFRGTRVERAEAAVRAACAIQEFTREQMHSHPEVARISEKIQVPGLGVAVGINLANTYCGLFGPNQQYTGFSTGMNQAARLQSLGGFRETLVMESAYSALAQSQAPDIQKLRFGPPGETAVKNVAQPLRYRKLLT